MANIGILLVASVLGPVQVAAWLAVGGVAMLLSLASQCFAWLVVGLIHTVALASASLEATSKYLLSGGQRKLSWTGILGDSRRAGFKQLQHEELTREVHSLKRQSKQLKLGLARASGASRRHLAVVGRSLHQKRLLSTNNAKLEKQMEELKQEVVAVLQESAKALKAQQDLQLRVTTLEKQQATLSRDNEELTASKTALEGEVEALEGWVRGEVEEKAQTHKRIAELQASNTDLAFLNGAMEEWIEGKDAHMRQLISENTQLFAKLGVQRSAGSSQPSTPLATPRGGDGEKGEGPGLVKRDSDNAFAFTPHTPEQTAIQAAPPAKWQSPEADMARVPLVELKRRFSKRLKDSSLSLPPSLSIGGDSLILSPAMTLGMRTASFSPAASTAADLLTKITDLAKSRSVSPAHMPRGGFNLSQSLGSSQGAAGPSQGDEAPSHGHGHDHRPWLPAQDSLGPSEPEDSPPQPQGSDGLHPQPPGDDNPWVASMPRQQEQRTWVPEGARVGSARSGNMSENGFQDAGSLTFSDDEDVDENGHDHHARQQAWALATQQLAQQDEQQHHQDQHRQPPLASQRAHSLKAGARTTAPPHGVEPLLAEAGGHGTSSEDVSPQSQSLGGSAESSVEHGQHWGKDKTEGKDEEDNFASTADLGRAEGPPTPGQISSAADRRAHSLREESQLMHILAT